MVGAERTGTRGDPDVCLCSNDLSYYCRWGRRFTVKGVLVTFILDLLSFELGSVAAL